MAEERETDREKPLANTHKIYVIMISPAFTEHFLPKAFSTDSNQERARRCVCVNAALYLFISITLPSNLLEEHVVYTSGSKKQKMWGVSLSRNKDKT